MRYLLTVYGLLFVIMFPFTRLIMAQELQVLVLDALDGKPQSNVTVKSLCVGPPSYVWGKPLVTNDKGAATIAYLCNDEQKLEISVYPPNKKEQCGDDAMTMFNDAASGGFISDPSAIGGIGQMWCPNKVSKTLKPVPGQVIMFVKKPTWWQSHVAGD
jgi:hypothetical protein